MVRTEFGLTKEIIRSKKRIQLVNSLFKRLQEKVFLQGKKQGERSSVSEELNETQDVTAFQIEQYALEDPVSFILEGVDKRLGRINYDEAAVNIEGF